MFISLYYTTSINTWKRAAFNKKNFQTDSTGTEKDYIVPHEKAAQAVTFNNTKTTV